MGVKVELDLALTSEREAKMKNGRREAMSCRERGGGGR